MLKKLTKRGSEDISELKLYWDTEKKQIRRKAHCWYCNAEIGCICYDNFMEAYEGIKVVLLCDTCWIEDNLKKNHLHWRIL